MSKVEKIGLMANMPTIRARKRMEDKEFTDSLDAKQLYDLIIEAGGTHAEAREYAVARAFRDQERQRRERGGGL